MPTATIATAADYADAMTTARRSKNWLYLLLMLLLIGQITMFFLVRFKVVVPPQRAEMTTATSGEPTTAPATTQPSAHAALGWRMAEYVVSISGFLGVVLSIVMCVVLLLIVNIMLVGRLIGVSRVTSAFVSAVLLVVLLFPWQVFRNQSDPLNDADEAVVDFKIPGVLYTWRELTQDATVDAKFTGDNWARDLLKWARFAGFPVLAVILLLRVQALSNRGLRLALGEIEAEHPEVAVAPPG